MPQQTTNLHRSQNRRQRFGLVLAGFIVIILAGLSGNQLWAAPRAQTVPPPTERPGATEEPRATATPVRNNDDDNDDAGNNPAPTATPSQETPSAPTTVTGVVTADRLNVRAGPSTSAAVLGTAMNGQTLSLLGRNADSSWWRICCVANTTTEGWVSADFVQLTAEAAEASADLPVEDGTTPAPTATVTATIVTAPITSTDTVSASLILTTPVATPSLEFIITQAPSFVWQGQELVLTLTVSNTGTTPAADLEMRTELPAAFAFTEVLVSNGGDFSEEVGDNEQVAITINWPTVEAGATVSAEIRLQVGTEIDDGTVFDILAVVSAVGGEAITEGISIGMPPTTLPVFQ